MRGRGAWAGGETPKQRRGLHLGGSTKQEGRKPSRREKHQTGGAEALARREAPNRRGGSPRGGKSTKQEGRKPSRGEKHQTGGAEALAGGKAPNRRDGLQQAESNKNGLKTSRSRALQGQLAWRMAPEGHATDTISTSKTLPTPGKGGSRPGYGLDRSQKQRNRSESQLYWKKPLFYSLGL